MQGSGGRIVAGSLDDGTSVEIVAQSPASAKVAQSLTIGQTYPITGACTRSQGMMKIKLRGATAVARTP